MGDLMRRLLWNRAAPTLQRPERGAHALQALQARFAVADRTRRNPALIAQFAALSEPLAGGNLGWYLIRNSADDAVDIYLYDEIGYWGITAGDFVDELTQITAARINLRINSPGGSVFDGLAIHSCLRAHPAQVTVHIDGLAASAASFIAQAGDRIVTARNAIMMIHDASGLCWGNAADMQEMAKVLDKLSDNCADMYAQRAGGTVAQWRERMLAETWYTGAEAVEAGLADAMTEPPAPLNPSPADEPEPAEPPQDAHAGRKNVSDPAEPTGRGRPGSDTAETVGTAGVTAPPPATSTSPVTVTFQPLVDVEALAAYVAATQPEPPAEDPAPVEPDGEPDDLADAWTGLTGNLLATIPAPPTVDGLFARLREAL